MTPRGRMIDGRGPAFDLVSRNSLDAHVPERRVGPAHGPTARALQHGASFPRNQGGLLMRRIPGLSLAVLALAVFGPISASSAAVVKVTPSNMNGWACFNDQTDAPEACSLVNGPLVPPNGVGSLQLSAPTT